MKWLVGHSWSPATEDSEYLLKANMNDKYLKPVTVKYLGAIDWYYVMEVGQSCDVGSLVPLLGCAELPGNCRRSRTQ